MKYKSHNTPLRKLFLRSPYKGKIRIIREIWEFYGDKFLFFVYLFIIIILAHLYLPTYLLASGIPINVLCLKLFSCPSYPPRRTARVWAASGCAQISSVVLGGLWWATLTTPPSTADTTISWASVLTTWCRPTTSPLKLRTRPVLAPSLRWVFLCVYLAVLRKTKIPYSEAFWALMGTICRTHRWSIWFFRVFFFVRMRENPY